MDLAKARFYSTHVPSLYRHKYDVLLLTSRPSPWYPPIELYPRHPFQPLCTPLPTSDRVHALPRQRNLLSVGRNAAQCSGTDRQTVTADFTAEMAGRIGEATQLSVMRPYVKQAASEEAICDCDFIRRAGKRSHQVL